MYRGLLLSVRAVPKRALDGRDFTDKAHLGEGLHCREPSLGLTTTDQNSVRGLQIPHGGALSEELWVGEDLESIVM